MRKATRVAIGAIFVLDFLYKEKSKVERWYRKNVQPATKTFEGRLRLWLYDIILRDDAPWKRTELPPIHQLSDREEEDESEPRDPWIGKRGALTW